jgi:hypothetical protein
MADCAAKAVAAISPKTDIHFFESRLVVLLFVCPWREHWQAGAGAPPLSDELRGSGPECAI